MRIARRASKKMQKKKVIYARREWLKLQLETRNNMDILKTLKFSENESMMRLELRECHRRDASHQPRLTMQRKPFRFTVKTRQYRGSNEVSQKKNSQMATDLLIVISQNIHFNFTVKIFFQEISTTVDERAMTLTSCSI